MASLVELDINPLLADSQGVVALDARIRLAPGIPGSASLDRLAIRPYPQDLEQRVMWQGEPLLLRPIKPEDGQAHMEFFKALDPEDVRFRMFIAMHDLQPSQLARLTQITAEFAVIVRSDIKGLGLGRILVSKLIDYCRKRGIQQLVGEALAQNQRLLKLVSGLGFTIRPSDHGLRPWARDAQEDSIPMSMIENRPFDELKLGDDASLVRTLGMKDIELFAVMSGDVNPAHGDPEFASGDVFHEVIAHGMWSGTLISTVLGTMLPGPGTIYLSQSLRFLHPIGVDDTVKVSVEVVELHPENHRVKLACRVVNQDSEMVVTGLAEVIAPTEKICRPRIELPEVTLHER